MEISDRPVAQEPFKVKGFTCKVQSERSVEQERRDSEEER